MTLQRWAKMWASRVIITAQTPQWAMTAAQSVTGFATSVIGCKCEAGIERELSENETPDLRPGVSILLFAGSSKAVGNRLIERIGQCIMTCPTTACFNGLEKAETTVSVGGKIRYFGDGYQASKQLDGRRLWRIPVMEGEFLIDDRFGVQRAVGGGNLLFLGKDVVSTLESAAAAMREVPGVILPFPGGLVRSGSKPGSKYKALPTPRKNPGKVREYIEKAYAAAADYIVSAMTITQLFAVRLAVLILALPAFLLLGMVAALTDGLVQRDLRKWGGGRESSFVYHWAKKTIAPSLILPWLIYLSMPVSVHPNLVVLPFAVFFALMIGVMALSFKKYL